MRPIKRENRRVPPGSFRQRAQAEAIVGRARSFMRRSLPPGYEAHPYSVESKEEPVIQQLRVKLPNRPGQLAGLLEVLATAKVKSGCCSYGFCRWR